MNFGLGKWFLLLTMALGLAAHAAEPLRCRAQFANLHNPFGPILVYAGSKDSQNPHFRRMTKADRYQAIQSIIAKLSEAARLAREGKWSVINRNFDNPKFMDGTGVTHYEPEGEVITLSPAQVAEFADPAKLKSWRDRVGSMGQWVEETECCRVQGVGLQMIDPKSGLVLTYAREMAPLLQERALILSEEIGHHLQALAGAEGSKPFVSPRMADSDFVNKLDKGLRYSLLENPDYLVRWLMRMSTVRTFDKAINDFKEKYPEGSPEVSAADRAVIAALPVSVQMVRDMVSSGEIRTTEGRTILKSAGRDAVKFFRQFPIQAEELMSFIIGSEMREADVYYMLKELYGAELINSEWRGRYLGRLQGDFILAQEAGRPASPPTIRDVHTPE